MPKTTKRIEKFTKNNNRCNICLAEVESLSEDHVPPKCCPPIKRRTMWKLMDKMIIQENFKGFERPKFLQSGHTYQTICAKCNNMIGSKYDYQLGDLSKKIQDFVETNLFLPSEFSVECYPNAIIRCILAHLLAARESEHDTVVDEMIRPCVLDASLPIPNKINVFYWVYPLDNIVICRDFLMPKIRNVPFGSIECRHFSLIKFYPLAFLIGFDIDNYEGLDSLQSFNQLPVSDKGIINIRFNNFKSATWPEECKDYENYLVVGKAFLEARYSVPGHLKKTTSLSSLNS